MLKRTSAGQRASHLDSTFRWTLSASTRQRLTPGSYLLQPASGDFKTWSLQAQLAPLCPLLLALLHPVSWCCLVQAHSPVGNALLPQAMPELSNIR